MVNSLSRRLKYKDDSNNLRKNIEQFLNYELKYFGIYYLFIAIYEKRVKKNSGNVKYRGKAFVNTKEGGNKNKSFKSPGNDFFVSKNENYNSTRILNSELKYSEKY